MAVPGTRERLPGVTVLAVAMFLFGLWNVYQAFVHLGVLPPVTGILSVIGSQPASAAIAAVVAVVRFLAAYMLWTVHAIARRMTIMASLLEVLKFAHAALTGTLAPDEWFSLAVAAIALVYINTPAVRALFAAQPTSRPSA